MIVGYTIDGPAGNLTWRGESTIGRLSVYDDTGRTGQIVAEVTAANGELRVVLGPLGSFSNEVLLVPIPKAVTDGKR